MLLLALDTSTSAVTVALHDGRAVLAQSSVVDVRGHGERLAPGIRQVLRARQAAPSDLSHVVVGVGPGPFTGLRVGVVTATMLAMATGASLHGVCSLDALAHEAVTESGLGGLLVATDARRKEVYWARYAGSPPARVEGPAVGRPAELPEWLRSLPTAGRGPLLYAELFARPIGPRDVSAAAVAEVAVHRLARGEELDPPAPRYLRRPDVAAPVAPKLVLG